MTRPRYSDGEWSHLLDQLDVREIDDGTADRLLTGSLPVDDAPPAHRGTAHAVAALTAPPRPHELAAQRAEVMLLSRELAAQARRDQARRVHLRKARRVTQLAATTVVGGVVLFGGLAAAGALPLH